jgi:hypothetical protein
MRSSLCPQYIARPYNLTHWLDPAWVPPPVRYITDDESVIDLIKRKYRNIAVKWESTKGKLIEERTRRGLNFKPWPKDGRDCYSVRIDHGYRAHLKHKGQGSWHAYILGTHEELGHG